jgi:flagellar basal-body rod protein FlgG
MRALYTAATGMHAQQLRIDNIANNLANVGTSGFKKSRESFEDLLYQNVPAGGASGENPRPNRIELGTGTRVVAIKRDFRSGDMTYSGNEFDIALGHRGFFVVEGPGGQEMYTRDGHFTKNADGELVTAAGLRLVPSIQIPEDTLRVIIAEDGTVQAEFQDQTELATLGTIELVDFVNASGLHDEGHNLYSASAESGEPILMDPEEGQVHFHQGYVETSNVDVAEELINMIMAQRAFELNSKVVETADQTMQVVNNLKR